MLGDVEEDEVEAAAEILREAGHDAQAVVIDVTNEASVEGAAQACVEAYGKIDALVANAGVLHLVPVVEMELRDWNRVIEVNLTGTFLCCRAFARQMVQRKGGRIIVTSSLFGRRGGRENGAYSASKFGVIGLVETLAAEVAEYGVLVNAICPGQVATEMMQELLQERADIRSMSTDKVESELLSKIPLGRMAEANEVGDVFVFLASDLSRYVTGQSIVVDGGWAVGP